MSPYPDQEQVDQARIANQHREPGGVQQIGALPITGKPLELDRQPLPLTGMKTG